MKRMTHDNGEAIVVFIIGMRINKLWCVHRWVPVFFAMPKMIAELMRDKNSGCLAVRTALSGRTIFTVQYWRSTDDLTRYAHDDNRRHRRAWLQFYKQAAQSDAVGIFHETYDVQPGRHESINVTMAPFGVGRATGGSIPVRKATDRFTDRFS